MDTTTEPPVKICICKNCGYHDPSAADAPRCPACNFRHASQPVHQVPVKEQEPAPEAEVPEAQVPEAQDKVKAPDPVKAEDKPSVVAVVTEEPSAEDKPADKPADGAVGEQTVRVVEKIVIVEKTPAELPVQEKPSQNAAQDATQAVEEQG